MARAKNVITVTPDGNVGIGSITRVDESSKREEICSLIDKTIKNIGELRKFIREL